MRIDELYANCELQIERVKSLKFKGAKAKIQLVIPGDPPKGEKIGMHGRYGPRGEVLSWTEKGTVAMFDAKKVKKFIEDNDLLRIEAERDKAKQAQGLELGRHD